MKKLMLAFVLLLGVVVSVKAQSIYGDKVKTDVKMKYIYSFEEALKKAREVNKPIFVNCFADWAVPCHGMNQLVFSDQQFADCRDQHGHRHARNGRMHARIVEQPPDHHGGHQVEEHAFFAHLLHEVDREHDDQCRSRQLICTCPP